LKQCNAGFLVRFCSLAVRTSLEIKPRDHVIVCVWSHGQQRWSYSDWTRTWFAVVTSYRPLLWLVIDVTSKAYTHSRRSYNSQLPQEKHPQHNTVCSFARRDWGHY